MVEIVQQQQAGQLIFARVGPQQEGPLKGHAVDDLGNDRDLVLLSYHLPDEKPS